MSLAREKREKRSISLSMSDAVLQCPSLLSSSGKNTELYAERFFSDGLMGAFAYIDARTHVHAVVCTHSFPRFNHLLFPSRDCRETKENHHSLSLPQTRKTSARAFKRKTFCVPFSLSHLIACYDRVSGSANICAGLSGWGRPCARHSEAPLYFQKPPVRNRRRASHDSKVFTKFLNCARFVFLVENFGCTFFLKANLAKVGG